MKPGDMARDESDRQGQRRYKYHTVSSYMEGLRRRGESRERGKDLLVDDGGWG